MNTFFDYLFLWRSLPVIIVYSSLQAQTKQLVEKDLRRMGRKPTILNLHRLMLHNSVFRRLFFVRVLNESKLKYRMIRWTYKPLESLEISADSGNIGGGLTIYHGYSTIIYCYSIGENFTVYQNVTIGRGKEINGIQVPIIGNNVTVYTGAIIIGGVHIGDNAVIGAGAVVVKDVPANTTVVGQPTRVISYKG